LLTLVRLDGLEQRRPAQLSGGQQQRVALARALAGRPALLLLDEPFSALDYPTRVELRNELRQLQRRFGTSMLFVTHDLGEANLLADVLVVVQNGQVIQAAPPHVVLSAPANTRVAQIVGIRNRLPGIVTAPGTVRAGDCELTAVTGSYPVGAHVWLCLRPERVMLVRRDRAPLSSIPNALAGELLAEESDGNHVLIQFRAQPRRLRPKEPFDLWIDTPVYVHERLQLAHERHWSVSLKPQAIHLVAE
jgi:ABC-type sulfate/molybdate transport systems ATPase subunit